MSLKVIISAAALVTVVGVLVSAAPAKHTFWGIVPGNSLSSDEFIVKIGQVLGYPRDNGRPIDYLSEVKDKNAKVILGTYSANDLLALNQASEKDLNEKEFTRRKELCSKFELKPEESDFVDKVAYNLRGYCEQVLSQFETIYLDRLEDEITDKLSKRDRENLKKLREIGKALEVNLQMRGIPRSGRAANLAGFLEGRDKKELDRIRETCNKLRGMISASPQKLRKGSKPMIHLEYCNMYLTN